MNPDKVYSRLHGQGMLHSIGRNLNQAQGGSCWLKVHVVEHTINLGKGAALKTGIDYALRTFRSGLGVVTADADGQHAPELRPSWLCEANTQRDVALSFTFSPSFRGRKHFCTTVIDRIGRIGRHSGYRDVSPSGVE